MYFKIENYFHKIWNSPTCMTWGSFFTRSLNLIVILPLLLTRFSTEEISLWFLFMIIIGLQMLVDIGFSPTFSRVIAYAMGGAEINDLKSPKNHNNGQPNWVTLSQICSTMRHIYLRLSVLWTLLLALFGTLIVIRPISHVDDAFSAWSAWGVILIVSTISFWGNIYTSYLQGVNQIALLRRWEMLTSFGSTCSILLVLLLGGGLLGVLIAHQGWQFLSVLRNRWLSGFVENNRFRQITASKKNEIVFDAIWPSAWRSGIGIIMSYGLIQASGILYAQVGTAVSVASYLLALRLIQTVSQFSQAPFYSKLPILARLFSEGRKSELINLSKKGMSFSHWSYVAGFLILAIIGEPILQLIGSNADFPDSLLWTLLGFGFFVERYGAMHIQLYSTTNHIIWHIANGVTGLIYLVLSLILFHFIGVYAFPIAILAGYLGFYMWYAALHSYKAFGLTFVSYEKGTSFLPLVLMVLYAVTIHILQV